MTESPEGQPVEALNSRFRTWSMCTWVADAYHFGLYMVADCRSRRQVHNGDLA